MRRFIERNPIWSLIIFVVLAFFIWMIFEVMFSFCFLLRVRNKLIKLENHLAFKLEGEDL